MSLIFKKPDQLVLRVRSVSFSKDGESATVRFGFFKAGSDHFSDDAEFDEDVELDDSITSTEDVAAKGAELLIGRLQGFLALAEELAKGSPLPTDRR